MAEPLAAGAADFDDVAVLPEAPMPGVAAAAAAEAFSDPQLSIPGVPSAPAPAAQAPPAAGKKRGRPPGPQAPRKRDRSGEKAKATKADVERENRELRARLGVTSPEVGTVAPAEPVDPASAIVALSALFSVVFGLLAEERGEHWRLKDDERDTLGQHFGTALAPYLPSLGAALPWLLGGTSLLAVLRSRLAEDKRLKREGGANGPRVVAG